MTDNNLAELNLHVSELMDGVDLEDCVGNLTIGYLLIWIHTIEQNSKKVMELSRFQEKMVGRYHATTQQVAEAFHCASDTFARFTGINIPQDEQTYHKDKLPFAGVYPFTSKVYLN